MNAHDKLKLLRSIISETESTVIAYSGGVDSSFLVRVAADVLGEKTHAVTAVSPTYTSRELTEATDFLKTIKVTHEIIETDEFSDERYRANPPDRCYYCKRELFLKLEEIRIRIGFSCILDGTNADDHHDHRPGLRAASEFNVRSPLAEAGLSKNEIRFLSRELGLDVADKPAQPCLASRIPYGTPVTPEKLSMIDRAETVLHQFDFLLCRVRHHGDIARIEIHPDDFVRMLDDKVRKAIIMKFKELGFAYIALDIEGYRMGSMNEMLDISSRVINANRK